MLVAGGDELNLGTVALGNLSWTSQIGSLSNTAPTWAYYCALWETNSLAQYLAAGDGGMVVSGIETNGNYSWNELADSPRSWLWQVTTNAGLYVAVGDQAVIMTSGNGVNWATEAIPYTNSVSVTNTVFFGVGGDTNLLIAVGNAGTIAVSTNNLTQVVTTNLLNGGLATNTVSTIGVVWRGSIPPHHDERPARGGFLAEPILRLRRERHDFAQFGRPELDQTGRADDRFSFRPGRVPRWSGRGGRCRGHPDTRRMEPLGRPAPRAPRTGCSASANWTEPCSRWARTAQF